MGMRRTVHGIRPNGDAFLYSVHIAGCRRGRNISSSVVHHLSVLSGGSRDKGLRCDCVRRVFSIPISSPISAGLLSLGTYVGVERWRLLFIVGGLVPILFSPVLYSLLPDSPETASFLEAEEKRWIILEHDLQPDASGVSFWQEAKAVFANGTWRMCTFCSSIDFAIFNSVVFWATLLVIDMMYGEDEGEGEDEESCGSDNGNEVIAVLVTAIPYLIAGMACLLGVAMTSEIVLCFHPSPTLSLAWRCWHTAGTPSSYFLLRFLLLICAITADGLCFPHVVALAFTMCSPISVLWWPPSSLGN